MKLAAKVILGLVGGLALACGVLFAFKQHNDAATAFSCPIE